MSQALFLGLVAVVALGRLAELGQSKGNQRRLAMQGANKTPEAGYRWMVLLHAGWLAGSAIEVVLFDRPFIAWLGIPALLTMAAANALRYWAIRALGAHWSTEVVDSRALGVVTAGPYRWVRHPNYAAVFVEVAALPLVHTAWWTAVAATVPHILVLRRRIEFEEKILTANPDYRRLMGDKARFVPGRWT